MFSLYLRSRYRKESMGLLALVDNESRGGACLSSKATHSRGHSPWSDKGGSRPGRVLRAELPAGPHCHRLCSTAPQVTAVQGAQVQRQSRAPVRGGHTQQPRSQQQIEAGPGSQIPGECLQPPMGMGDLGSLVGISIPWPIVKPCVKDRNLPEGPKET